MFFTQNKKTISLSLFFVFVLGGALSPLFDVYGQAGYGYGQGLSQTNAVTQHAGNNNKLGANFGCGAITSGIGPAILGCAAALINYLFVGPATTVAGWTAILFNVVFFKLVVGMGTIINGTSTVTLAWSTLRDIGNIFLVFLLVYVGIATILGISGYGYKQLLWRIVLAALLVNFSITFTKLIIDVSNMLAVEIWNEIVIAASPARPNSYAGLQGCIIAAGQPIPTSTSNPNCFDNGLTGAFISQLKTTQTYNIQALINANPSASTADLQKVLIISFLMTGIMFSIQAFVFGAAAFLLISRFTILVFLLIVSPFALIVWITKVSSAGSKWWHALLNQAFFAPLVLLMWYVAYILAGGLGNSGVLNPNNAPSLATGGLISPANISTTLSFSIISAFLIAGLVVAKKFGAYGASGAMNIGKKWSRRSAMVVGAGAGAMSAGVIGAGGRRFVGSRAAKTANDGDLIRDRADGNWLRRNKAKLQLATADKLAGASFDARGLSKSKVLGKPAGKGGYNKWAENKKKRDKDLNERLGKYSGTKDEKAEAHKGLKDIDKSYKQSDKMRTPSSVDNTIVNNERRLKQIQKEKGKVKNQEEFTKLQKEESKLKENQEELKIMKGGVVERAELSKQLKDTTLSGEKRKELEQKQKLATDTVKSGYGLIDNNVATKDKEIKEIQEEIKKLDAKRDKKIIDVKNAEIKRLEDTRKAIINYHEANDSLARGQSTKQQVAQARSTLDEARISDRTQFSREVQQYYKEEGAKLQNKNLDRISTQRNLGGRGWTPQYRKDAVSEIRKDGDKSKKQRAIETLAKELEKDDSGGTAPAPTPPETPPSNT